MIARWEVLAYSARLPTGRGYLLKVYDDAGRLGLGEARALPEFGSGPAALDAFFARKDSVESLLHKPQTYPATPVEARFAVETATTDLAAQVRGVSLVEQLGCVDVQGYLFHPPLTFDQLSQQITGRRPSRVEDPAL